MDNGNATPVKIIASPLPERRPHAFTFTRQESRNLLMEEKGVVEDVPPPPPSKPQRGKKISRSFVASLLSFFPIISWLPKYDLKENFVADLIGGLTVGIMHVPQGISYASLAGVRPVHGLYTSLFAPFFYMIFGTSRHVSLGVFAVVSLMSGACNVRLTNVYMEGLGLHNLTEEAENEMRLDYAIVVVSALALMIGLIMIALAVCRLDFLIGLLSDQVINGFTIGASVHVLVAQLDKLLGVSLPRQTGMGKIFLCLRDVVMAAIGLKINVYTTLFSILAMIFLFIGKLIVDPQLKNITKLPFPYDLLLLIFGTLLSALFDFNGSLHVKVIGTIPTGLPSLSFPSTSLLPWVFGDAVAIAVVILVVTIAMAKLFAKKHNYSIDVRQEFYALGFMECLCSFLPVWPSSTALARTLVYEAAGTKTQLATVFSSVLLLSVIFFIGQFLEKLPVCFLSCIIVVALKGMFMKLGEIPSLWRASRRDAIIFLVCFLSTVCLDVIQGLIVGVIAGVLNILFKSEQAEWVHLHHVVDEGAIQFTGPHKCRGRNVRCIRYDGGLFFLNCEKFADDLKRTGHIKTHEEDTAGSGGRVSDDTQVSKEGNPDLVVVDLSTLRFIDYNGACALFQTIEALEESDVCVMYCSVPLDVLAELKSHGETWRRLSIHFFLERMEDLRALARGETVRSPSSISKMDMHIITVVHDRNQE